MMGRREHDFTADQGRRTVKTLAIIRPGPRVNGVTSHCPAVFARIFKALKRNR